MVVDHVLEFLWAMLDLVENHMVVNRARCSLKSNVRVQKEIPVVRARHISLDQNTWQRVSVFVGSVSVARFGESPQVVSLVCHDDGELSFPLVLSQLHEDGLHVEDLLLKNLVKLTGRDTVTEVINVRRSPSASDGSHPFANKRSQHDFNVGASNHFVSFTVGLARTPVATTERVHANCYSRH